MPRVRILNHNPAGGSFWTPKGIVRTDNKGYAEVSPEQLAHLKSLRGITIATGDMPSGSLATREIVGRKRRTQSGD
jgi:hypothetical protein